jgi:hypothetical protein
MFPLSINTDDPYGLKKLESSNAQTPTRIRHLFNQVAREWGLGELTDAEDSEQILENEESQISEPGTKKLHPKVALQAERAP